MNVIDIVEILYTACILHLEFIKKKIQKLFMSKNEHVDNF